MSVTVNLTGSAVKLLNVIVVSYLIQLLLFQLNYNKT